jgi:citrate synthase
MINIMRMAILIPAEEACALLGVTRQTLYSDVSRGLLSALPGADHRTRLYRRAEVERLARRPLRRRSGQAARGALVFGPPLMESALSLIENGRLYFRGIDAEQLAASASLEDVARLLWQDGSQPALADPFSAPASAGHTLTRSAAKAYSSATPLQRALALFTLAPAEADGNDPAGLLREMAAVLLDRKVSAAPLHQQCARAWKQDRSGEDMLRGALVLCADHELNASSFAARVVASTGASLREALRGGLAAMSGPRHGQAISLIEAMWQETEAGAAAADVLGRHLQGGTQVPGFGHPLYRNGDPRASWILSRLPAAACHPRLQVAAAAQLGEAPNIDFAQTALRRHLGLPPGSAFVIFCLGRSVGWIAHALEQRPRGLIRPRAVYVGELPPRAN